MKTLYLLLAFIGSSFLAKSQLDSTFGVYGIVDEQFDASSTVNIIYALAQQTDRKIIAAGTSGASCAIIRLYNNGTVDSNFGVSGRVIKKIDDAITSKASGVEIQPDGRIVVAGTSREPVSGPDNSDDFTVARFLLNGLPDSTFNNNGEARIDISGRDICNDISLQNDGMILLVGQSAYPDSLTVVRLNSDGTKDHSFNGTGIFKNKYGDFGEQLRAVEVKNDGTILTCGDVNKNGVKVVVLQLKPDGTLDSAFGTDGAVMTDNTGFGHDIALQTDGKILVAGRNVFTGGFVIRYLPDGNLDISFGNGGKALLTHPEGTVGPEQVAIDKNGKIYVAGHIYRGTYEDMYFVRLNADGSIDAGYSGAGIVTQVSQTSERTHNMIIQDDGKILTAGQATGANGQNFGMLRYWPFPLNIGGPEGEVRSKIFTIYPNPATTCIWVDIPEDDRYYYYITDVYGRKVKSGTVITYPQSKQQIVISEFPSGNYLFFIQSISTGQILKSLISKP